MKLFDLFKKKNAKTPPSETISPTVSDAELVSDIAYTAEETSGEDNKKTTEITFEEWYSKLTPEVRKKVDRKLEKLRIKQGISICCKRCGRPGSTKETGPFRKIDDDIYVHQNCQIGGIRG